MAQLSIEIVKELADKANYNRRIHSIIFHYTNLPYAESLEILRDTGVSVHFLIPREQEIVDHLKIIELVEIHDRAYHAGVSTWQSRTNLNDTSVGIEIINYGFGFIQQDNSILYYHQINETIKTALINHLEKDDLLQRLKSQHLLQAFLVEMLYGRLIPRDQEKYTKAVSENIRDKYRKITQKIRVNLPDPFMKVKNDELYTLEKTGKIVWDTFEDDQIEALIHLVKEIVKKTNIEENGIIRYQISPTAMTGHADIAPGRKQDPGPKFPWKQLAAVGIGAWPDESMVLAIKETLNENTLNIAWLQKNLNVYGYGIQITKVFDPQTRDVLVSFQMHFRPDNYSGHPDIETFSILGALIQKYYPDQYAPPV